MENGSRALKNEQRTVPITPASLSGGSGGVLLADAHRWVPIIAVSALVLLGALLRLHDLTKSTVGHIEIYVPGIELPYDLSDPRPRLTLLKTISGTIAGEPHPPGYYVAMFGWTKLFGTGVAALRLPSVLFGVGSILLIYMLGTLAQERLTAVLAAGMLSLNGHHLFWSQTAKLYSMACFLGLLSTALLLWMSQRDRRGYVPLFLYVGAALAGAATSHFFWPLFVTHMLWVLGRNLASRTPMPSLLRWQILVLILGSPLWAIAAYQSQRPSYLGGDVLAGLSQFLQFGFLFEPDPWALSTRSVPLAVMTLSALSALCLLACGLRERVEGDTETVIVPGLPSVVIMLAAIPTCVGILLFAGLAHLKGPAPTLLIVACGMAPPLLVLLDLMLRRYWSRLQDLGGLLYHRRVCPSSPCSLSSLLAMVPVALMAGVSLLIPVFASRTVLLFTPYLLVVLSRGLSSLIHQDRRWIALLAVVALMHFGSVLDYKQRLHHPTDYKGLAEQWIPRIGDSDLIFVQRHWATTPIFYYLKADDYHFVGWDYSAETERNPDARVWVLSFEGLVNPDDMHSALEHYDPLDAIEALRVKAELYGPD